jgi:putative DNA primase/helicase
MLPPDGAAKIRRIIELSEPEFPRLRAFSAAEFLSLELPPRGMVLEPILPEKGLALLHAYRGIGKTHLALGMGFAIASGAELLGLRAPEARRVLYLDGEMPANTMQARLAAVVAGFEVLPPDPSHFHILAADLIEGGLPDLATADGQAEIDAVIARLNSEVIIVDNISTLVRSGRENEAEGWLPVQTWALAHRRAGRSILLVHHDGKTGMQRGTSRREDVLDTVIGLRRPADYRSDQGARFEVHFEKARGFHGDAALPFEARYEERDGAALWTRSEILDEERDRVVEALGGGISIRAAASQLGMHRSKVERLKKKAVEQGMFDG